jgi:hypothetical protein
LTFRRKPRDFRDAVLGKLRQAFFVDVGGKYRGTFARKGDRRSAANTCCACGDEGAFAFQAV